MKPFTRNLVRRKRLSFDIVCLINLTVAQSCLSGHRVAAASLGSRIPWVSEDLGSCGGYVPPATWQRHRAPRPCSLSPCPPPWQRPGPAAGRRGGSPGAPPGRRWGSPVPGRVGRAARPRPHPSSFPPSAPPPRPGEARRGEELGSVLPGRGGACSLVSCPTACL